MAGKKPAKRGRKSKLTPQVTSRLCKALRLQATARMACQYAGLGESTFYKYLQQGEKDLEAEKDSEFVEFRNAIKGAEADGVIAALAKIEKAANEGTWQAAAWKLERRYPRDYGRSVQEIHGEDGGPIKITIRRSGEGK